MDIESIIKTSKWWKDAEAMPDRHYSEAAGVTLANHLEAVRRNLRLLQPFEGRHPYYSQLQTALESSGITPDWIQMLLGPVALLHDIGKVREEKKVEGLHPLSEKAVMMRHPILGLIAALELLPDHLPGRETILALIEEHDTPYSWYRQYEKTQQIPKAKAWAQLDRKIDARGDGTGLVLLSIFKIADIDGHESLADVSWFIENANEYFLHEKGKALPVPDRVAIESLK